MKKDTAALVRKAEADFAVVAKLRDVDPPLHDPVCFHCQQGVEKYLKALMVELGLPVPKTHDLGRLQSLLVPHDPSIRPFRRGLLFLTTFAVETRYPGENATRRDSTAAIRWAQRIRQAIRTCLRLRTRP